MKHDAFIYTKSGDIPSNVGGVVTSRFIHYSLVVNSARIWNKGLLPVFGEDKLSATCFDDTASWFTLKSQGFGILCGVIFPRIYVRTAKIISWESENLRWLVTFQDILGLMRRYLNIENNRKTFLSMVTSRNQVTLSSCNQCFGCGLSSFLLGSEGSFCSQSHAQVHNLLIIQLRINWGVIVHYI